jgi:hypothetical protein
MFVDPDVAPGLIVRLRRIDGVLAAGWQATETDPSTAIRVGAQQHRQPDGRIDGTALATAAGRIAAELMGATLQSGPTREPTTGEYTVVLTRPSQSVPVPGLTEQIELTVQVVPEKLAADDKVIAFIEASSLVLKDMRDGPKVGFGSDGIVEGTDPRLGAWTEAMTAAVARKVNGETWDGDKAAWTSPP